MEENKLKKYETQPVLKFHFKKMCSIYHENYGDYDEIFTGTIRKNGSKLYNYFFKGPNQGKQAKFKSTVKPIDYYETHPINAYRFKKRCEAENKNYDFFEKIYSGKKIYNIKLYFYTYKGRE